MATPKRSRSRASQRHDQVWAALADPTRRAILDLLREQPRTVGELTNHFSSSRFAVRKHLNVLEAARLVVVRWHGRERWNHLNAAPLQQVYERWVTPYRQVWAGRLAALKQHAEGDTRMTARPKSVSLERVELEIDIAAPPPRVWTSLTAHTTQWWPKSFYTGPAKAFLFEPRIGGRLYEDWGGGAGVIWYVVFAVNPGVSIDLQGNLAVPFGPGISLLHLELAPHGTGTRFAVSDSTFGSGGDAQAKEAGWREVFGDGLKRFAEHSR
jgi:DNA-binding transcriptional ArsR family regulator/uncharacterized protein YndB with AHSA1/START domain